MIERPMTLLVVDDNPGDAELLQFMLAKGVARSLAAG
jgi:hypothetical protein